LMATALPRPREAPVTRAILVSRLLIFIFF